MYGNIIKYILQAGAEILSWRTRMSLPGPRGMSDGRCQGLMGGRTRCPRWVGNCALRRSLFGSGEPCGAIEIVRRCSLPSPSSIHMRGAQQARQAGVRRAGGDDGSAADGAHAASRGAHCRPMTSTRVVI